MKQLYEDSNIHVNEDLSRAVEDRELWRECVPAMCHADDDDDYLFIARHLTVEIIALLRSIILFI